MSEIIRCFVFEEKVPGGVSREVADALARLTAELSELRRSHAANLKADIGGSGASVKSRAMDLLHQAMGQVAGSVNRQVGEAIRAMDRLTWETGLNRGDVVLVFTERAGLIPDGNSSSAHVWLEGDVERPVLQLDLWVAGGEKKTIRDIEGFGSCDECLDFAIAHEYELRKALSEGCPGQENEADNG